MKKLIVTILSLVLLAGSVFGIAISAEETDNSVEILAQNIVYNDRVAVVYAVDATVEEARNGDVRVFYYWAEDGVATLKEAQFIDPDASGSRDNTLVFKGQYPIFYTEGVPAKELGKVACVTACRGTAPAADATYKSYSAVQYLYSKLFKDGIAFATEGDDALRRDLYTNLLMYGAAAQELLVNKDLADEDKVTLVTDYSYIYTTTDGVTINGVKQIVSPDAFEATFVYSGDQMLEGWTVTVIDEDCEPVDVDGNTYTVSGIIKVEPKFGVHECADEDPADHRCDTCNAEMSECVVGDNGHFCDVCGKHFCVNTCFSESITEGVRLATGSAVIQNSIIKGETYTPVTKSGIWGNIVTVTKTFENGREEVSDVLKLTINNGEAKNTSVTTLGGEGTFYYAPAISSNNNGNIHVLEFDFNWSQATKKGYRNPITLFAYDAEGNVLGNIVDANGSDNQYCVWAINNGGAFTEGTVVENAYQLGISGTQTEIAGGKFRLFDSDTWYRIRYIWNESTGEVYISASDDNGVTWYQACTMQAKKAYADAAYLAFSCDQIYGSGGYVYLDDISYNIVSELPELPANNGL